MADFFYLAEAASAMRFGPSERNGEWDYDKEIVHRDIKPPNSMLTDVELVAWQDECL